MTKFSYMVTIRMTFISMSIEKGFIMSDITTILIVGANASAFVGIFARMALMERRIEAAARENSKVYNITYTKGDRGNSPFEVAAHGGQSSAVMCGGCGKSVPTFDGFNPIAHDCFDPEQSSSESEIYVDTSSEDIRVAPTATKL